MGFSSPSGGAANSVGSQQTTAVTGLPVSTTQQTALDGQFGASDPVGRYTSMGYEYLTDYSGNGKNVFEDPKTGQIIVADSSTGTVVNQYKDWSEGGFRGDPLSASFDAGSLGDQATWIKNHPTNVVQGIKDSADQGNIVGTPGIDPAVGQKISDTVVDTVTGGGPNNVTVGGDGVSVGGNPVNLPSLTGGTSTGQIMDPIQAAIARQSAVADQMGSAYSNFTPTGAPTAASPQAIQAAMAQQQDPIQAAIAQAQTAQAAQIGQTALTPQQQAIQAQQIAAGQIAPLQQAQTGQIAPTQVGQTTLAGAAALDPTQQAQMRASQAGLVSGLQDAIAGKEPSAAEIMLRNATDRNVANQYAMAQAANGMNTGFSQRTAMINAADANQQAIMQQALLRAQEIQSARGQLGSVLDSARGQDIGLASQQAGLQQQANLANAGAQNTSTLTQAQINAAQAQQQAQLGQSSSQFNAGQYNTAAVDQAQMQQAASIANQQAGLQAGTANATLAQQAAIANAGALNTTNQQNAAMQQAAGLQNAQLGTQASLANANNQTQANTTSAQLSNAVNLANANNQSQANTATGQLQTQTNIANANNAVSTNALNQKAQQDLAANQLTATGQAGQTAVGGGNVQAELAKAEAARQAALLGGVATAGAALLSDRREKKDIRKAEAEIAEFTKKLGPAYAFRYKAPGKPGTAPGQRFGTMVDELEKSAVGRSLVRDMGDGSKGVDVPQSIGVILATLSAMNKRIEAR